MPKLKPTCPRKQKNSWNPWSQSGGCKGRRTTRKRFVVRWVLSLEWKREGGNRWWQWWWRKWRTDMCEIRWEW